MEGAHMAKADGWSVWQSMTGDLFLRSGGDGAGTEHLHRNGYVFRAWTAGTKRDGNALLAEVKKKVLARA